MGFLTLIVLVIPFSQFALVYVAPLLLALSDILDDFRDRVYGNDSDQDKNRCKAFGHSLKNNA